MGKFYKTTALSIYFKESHLCTGFQNHTSVALPVSKQNHLELATLTGGPDLTGLFNVCVVL